MQTAPDREVPIGGPVARPPRSSVSNHIAVDLRSREQQLPMHLLPGESQFGFNRQRWGMNLSRREAPPGFVPPCHNSQSSPERVSNEALPITRSLPVLVVTDPPWFQPGAPTGISIQKFCLGALLNKTDAIGGATSPQKTVGGVVVLRPMSCLCSGQPPQYLQPSRSR